jgi:hypothetical protein
LNEGNYDAYGPIILSLPCNQPQFSMLSYENLTSSVFNLGSSNLSNIDIQIRNENGQLLDLNNQEFTITFKIKRILIGVPNPNPNPNPLRLIKPKPPSIFSLSRKVGQK